MSSTSYAVLVVALIAGTVVWYFLYPSTENLKDNLNETDGTTTVTKLSMKAWLFYINPSSSNQTVIELDPATKSLTPVQPYNFNDELVQGLSTQNDYFGAVICQTQTITKLFLFDKNEKKVVALSNISSNYEYDTENLCISDENVILLSSPEDGKCQTVTVYSPRKKEIIETNIAMKVCRWQTYCMASTKTGDVYVFGGYDDNSQSILSSQKYSADFKSTEAIADLPGSMASTSQPCKATEHKGKVMVCDNDLSLGQGCYLYTPADDQWEMVGRFSADRLAYELVVIGNDLFAIGGKVSGSLVTSIEMYNEQNKSWEVFMNEIEGFQTDFIAFTL